MGTDVTIIALALLAIAAGLAVALAIVNSNKVRPTAEPPIAVEIFVFSCHGHNAPAYGCSKPGDNSGEYVRLDDYLKLAKLLGDQDT